MWCLLPAGLPGSGKLPVLFLLRGQKSDFSPRRRLVAPIQFKLGRADGHRGPLGRAKFHLNRHSAVGMRPQKYQKFLP